MGIVPFIITAFAADYHRRGAKKHRQPHPSLGHAEAKYLSPVGEIVSGWRYDGNTVRYHFSLPVNTTARVILPDGREALLGQGDHTM